MSATIARRLNRVEGDRLTAAISHFADYCHRIFTAPAIVAADTAALAADPEEDEDTPCDLALWDVIALTTQHPTDQQGIRAALATVAPFVVILTALEGLLARS